MAGTPTRDDGAPQPSVPMARKDSTTAMIVSAEHGGSGLPWGLPPAEEAKIEKPARNKTVPRPPESPYPASGNPPGPEAKDSKPGWRRSKMPDGQAVWVDSPRNEVEGVSGLIVIERRGTSARYCCMRCSTTFWGSKERIKDHFRGLGKDVKPCSAPITQEDEAAFARDDERGGALEDETNQGTHGRKRKHAGAQQQDPMAFDTESPYPGTDQAPSEQGWMKAKDPRFDDARMIWVAEPKNDIERLASVLVVDRRSTSSRYLCVKCGLIYWGSKIRVKEHLRNKCGRVSGCSARLTPAEEECLAIDDATTVLRTGRMGKQVYGFDSCDKDNSQGSALADKGERMNGELGSVRGYRSPFPGAEPPPDGEGWCKATAPDGAEIWVSEAKNAVERLVLVIERRNSSARFLCTKCGLMFWGSKKRIKEHLRHGGSSVSACSEAATAEEEAVMRNDDHQEGAGDSRPNLLHPADGPPPSDSGWVKGALPDGQEVWLAEPKNAIERLDSVLVVDRKHNNSRFYCNKCGVFFSGTKKRVKDHLRRISRDVKPCSVGPTEQEEAILAADDEQLDGRSAWQPASVIPTHPPVDKDGVPLKGRKLKEHKMELSTEADLAWFKLFERYDIPKRIIETEEMREALRKSMRAGPSYVLPTRSRMGDDTPGHKADPNKRGALRRSKPDGLMYLALQSLQEEERQTGTSGGGSVGGGLQSGYARQAVLGLGEGALLEDGSGILEGLGGGGKMMHMRKRGNKPNSRLLDRKNALSLRLKVHWRQKDQLEQQLALKKKSGGYKLGAQPRSSSSSSSALGVAGAERAGARSGADEEARAGRGQRSPPPSTSAGNANVYPHAQPVASPLLLQ